MKYPVREGRCQRGTVTAEAAVVIPVLVLVTLSLVWVVSLGVTQVRLVDAARETARAVARGDDPESARQRAFRGAPAGTVIAVSTAEREVRVVARATVRGPGGLLTISGIELDASAVAAREDS